MYRFDLCREQVRTPTDTWGKFSLSKSSPFALETPNDRISQWPNQENLNVNSTTGLIECVPWNDRQLLGQFPDIQSLLCHLKLEHYISN